MRRFQSVTRVSWVCDAALRRHLSARGGCPVSRAARLLVSYRLDARRIAEGPNASGHVTSDHTTRADQGVVADRHARQDNRATADPHVMPDTDRTTKLQPGGSCRRVAWVIGCEDLNPWPDLRFITNDDLHDIEDHAVEVQ